MKVIAYIPAMLAVAYMLAGCATMGELDQPPRWCLEAGSMGEALKQSDDLVQKAADQQQKLEAEIAKNRCLRRWVKAASGKA
jgi:hypothetical protein